MAEFVHYAFGPRVGYCIIILYLRTKINHCILNYYFPCINIKKKSVIKVIFILFLKILKPIFYKKTLYSKSQLLLLKKNV